MAPRTESVAAVLRRFGEDHVMVRKNVQGANVHTCLEIAKTAAVIDKAREEGSTKQDVCRKLRGKVFVVRLLQPAQRPAQGKQLKEVALLEALPTEHNNIQPATMYQDEISNAFVKLRYVGPSVAQLLKTQRKSSHILELPPAFIWKILWDVVKGLAFLHYGVQQIYVPGLSNLLDWDPIAHGTREGSIMLDINHMDWYGYPRAVLTDFSQAKYMSQDPNVMQDSDGDSVMEGSVDGVESWQPANDDLESVADIIHQLFHGRKYRNTFDRHTGRWCNCNHPVPDELPARLSNREDPHDPLARLLEQFCDTTRSDIRTLDLLARLNMPGSHARRLLDAHGIHGYQLPADVYVLFHEAEVSEEQFKAILPELDSLPDDRQSDIDVDERIWVTTPTWSGVGVWEDSFQ